MNLVKAAREALGLTQVKFGVWLAEQLGKDKPIPAQRVNEWENGIKSPRRNIREVCAPVAAIALANDAVAAVERTHLLDITKFDELPPDLRCVRDEIADWVQDLIV